MYIVYKDDEQLGGNVNRMRGFYEKLLSLSQVYLEWL
jgi:hypothetical protein